MEVPAALLRDGFGSFDLDLDLDLELVTGSATLAAKRAAARPGYEWVGFKLGTPMSVDRYREYLKAGLPERCVFTLHVMQWTETPQPAFASRLCLLSEDAERGVEANAFMTSLMDPSAPVPCIDRVTPGVSGTRGGDRLRVYGRNFLPGARVLFDGKPASAVEFVSGGELVVHVPAMADGARRLVVVNAEGNGGQASLQSPVLVESTEQVSEVDQQVARSEAAA